MLYARLYRDDVTTVAIYVVNRYEDRDGGDNLTVRIEKEQEPDSFCEWHLPDIFCYKSYGFSEEELAELEVYLQNNEIIIWDMYREYEYIHHAG